MNEARLKPGTQGLWIPKFNLIILDEHLSPAQRRCVLAHEISHAKHRDMACEHDGAMEARADREAAHMLLSVVTYAAAEQVYDGNTHMMALELGVMPWVVDAYREWLHDNPNMAIQ